MLFTALDQEELVLLQEFAAIIRTNSIVGEQIHQTIHFLKELNTNRADEKGKGPVDKHMEAKEAINAALRNANEAEAKDVYDFELPAWSNQKREHAKVCLAFGDLHIRDVMLPKHASSNTLKSMIENCYESMENSAIIVTCVANQRTGIHWHRFDDNPTIPSAFTGGDVLTVEHQSVNPTFTGVDRVYNAGLKIRTPFQFLALTLHAFMIDEGFFLIVEVVESPHMQNRPWRKVPAGKFVRDNWDCDPCTLRLTYRHEHDEDNTLCKLMVSDLVDTAVASLCLADASEQFHIVDLPIDYFVFKQDGMPIDFCYIAHPAELRMSLVTLINNVLPSLPIGRSGEKAENTPTQWVHWSSAVAEAEADAPPAPVYLGSPDCVAASASTFLSPPTPAPPLQTRPAPLSPLPSLPPPPPGTIAGTQHPQRALNDWHTDDPVQALKTELRSQLDSHWDAAFETGSDDAIAGEIIFGDAIPDEFAVDISESEELWYTDCLGNPLAPVKEVPDGEDF